MNKATLKSRATLVGKAFAAKGVKLTRAEQLDLVAQLEGARDWHHACGELTPEATSEATGNLDELQLEAAQAYCSGDFSHVTEKSAVATIGDTLFQFAISEIGEAGGERDEAVRMMRQGAGELNDLADALESNEWSTEVPGLELVPKQSEPAMYFDATTSTGKPLEWRIRLISDRFGEVNPRVKSAYPHLADWVGENQQAFDKMAGLCLEEMAFVAEVNGQRGVLYEVEIVTSESEGQDAAGNNHCDVSEEKRRAQLQRDVTALELLHPNLHWAIGGPIGMTDDRLGVWAFCPEATLFSYEEAKAVTESLYSSFYPS